MCRDRQQSRAKSLKSLDLIQGLVLDVNPRIGSFRLFVEANGLDVPLDEDEALATGSP
jgi:hypothetical protein